MGKEFLLNNPLIYSDFPDPDVILVGDTYYMISTTMNYYPGGAILRSYDLINWEFAGRVFDELGGLPCEKLVGDMNSYRKGMWAAALRYHEGLFYVLFTAFETESSFIFTCDRVDGHWTKHVIPEICHDAGLLFDDGKIYMVYGAGNIRLREVKPTLDGFVEGGIDRIIYKEQDEVYLPVEGSHFYKINGRYFLSMIHWPKAAPTRREQMICYCDTIDGDYIPVRAFNNDIGFFNNGVAQGCLVETPTGEWFSVMLQDRGGIGRVPVIVPITWENNLPVFHDPRNTPAVINPIRADYEYEPLYTDDFFAGNDSSDKTVKLQWEWNHMPNEAFYERLGNNELLIRNGKVCSNVTQTQNMLTQRMFGPKCSASVYLDASGLKDGDCAGMAAFISNYVWIGVRKEIGRYFLVVYSKETQLKHGDDEIQDFLPSKEEVCIPMDGNIVELKVSADFTDMKDMIELSYKKNGRWVKVFERKVIFELVFFVGCRFGLFNFATKRKDGEAVFWNFKYNYSVDMGEL